jgi:hypothetical protein
MSVSYHAIVGFGSSETIVLSDSSSVVLSSNRLYLLIYSVIDDGAPSFLVATNFDLPESDSISTQYPLPIGELAFTRSHEGAFSYYLTLNSANLEASQLIGFSVDTSYLSYLNGLDGGGTTDTSLLDSLNGNFGSYPDGTYVTVQGLTTRTYTVQSSSLGWDSPSTGSLIITYRLKDSDGNFLEAPHVLLSQKIEAV